MTANNQEQKRKEKIEALLAVVGGARRAALFLHDNPDPDAIASGFALRYILWRLARVRSELVAFGTLRRPENGEMIRELRIKIRSPEEIDFRRFKLIACLDTQPQAGNNSLPRKVTPEIIIDHHPARHASEASPFTDLRVGLGATSTILSSAILVAVGYAPAPSGERVRMTTGSGVEYVSLVSVERIAALGTEQLDFPVISHTLPPTASVDGLVGLDFFRDRRLTIDFRAGEIILE